MSEDSDKERQELWVKPKIFTLCPHCNKEHEMPLSEDLHAFCSTYHMCPHCDATVHNWVKIPKAVLRRAPSPSEARLRAALVEERNEIIWLYTHCRAIGMIEEADPSTEFPCKEGRDIAHFTITLTAKLATAREALEANLRVLKQLDMNPLNCTAYIRETTEALTALAQITTEGAGV